LHQTDSGGIPLKAIVFEKYGSPDDLKLGEVKKPTPKDDEVLIKIMAASVNPIDWRILRGKPFMIRLMGFGTFKPKINIPGADIAGRVESAGANVKEFQPGDEVFADLSGSGWHGFAEYVCSREEALVPKPINLTFEEAAAVPLAGVTALQGLRDHGRIQAGQKVLINGATGGVGSFAVQIAKSYEANVTAVCSTGKLELARSLGADHVIDYTQKDFTRGDQHYDLILDNAAYRSFADYKRALSSSGVYVLVGGSMAKASQLMMFGSLISRGGKKLTGMLAKPVKKDLIFLKELIEVGKVKPVIDRRYALSEVPEALRYLDEGHATGKVIISVDSHS
jgi:NADPH:quinone reductase-like Zn-dependent oxidoreductase